MQKVQQHKVCSAKRIKAFYTGAEKQTVFQTWPRAVDLPAMPVSLLKTSFSGVRCGKNDTLHKCLMMQNDMGA